MSEGIPCPSGPGPTIVCSGSYGPNDLGYVNMSVRSAAGSIRNAAFILSEGHYPHSNAKVLPQDHPTRLALQQLAILDRETAEYANTTHQPELFVVHEPTEQAQNRWNKDSPHYGFKPIG